MKVPLSWIREFVDVTASAEEIGTLMGVRGLALEGLERHGDDVVMDFDVTANRPDCMSVIGIAREIATAFDLPLRIDGAASGLSRMVAASNSPASNSLPLRIDGVASGLSRMVAASNSPAEAGRHNVTIEDPDLCGRYVAAIADVTVGPSPPWMQDRLTMCGVRPISNIVDITNYVMLELGQPMHAFDLAKMRGGVIKARRAKAGETMTTLDGKQRTLTADMLVIADADHAEDIAGVMGGANSEVTSATTRIAFEAAYFKPACIRATSKKLGHKTEASMRFERGMDITAPPRAMARACELLEKIGAGTSPAAIADVYPAPHQPKTIRLERARIAGLLGMAVPDHAVERILTSLGFEVRSAAATAPAGHAGWDITPPAWRVDMHRQVDLIEEVGRHHGFEHLPTTFPGVEQAPPPSDPRIARDRRVRHALLGMGFSEAITFAFVEAKAAAPFLNPPTSLGASGDQPVALANPLSELFAVMRPSLLPGVIDALGHNRRHGRTDARLFEIGTRFSPRGETRGAGFGWMGLATADHWSGARRPVDFSDLKGVVEQLAALFNVELTFTAVERAFLVPGRAAAINVNGHAAGVFGQLAPAVGEARDLPGADEVYVGEVDLDVLSAASPAETLRATTLPKYPSVVRDISILVNDSLSAETVRGTIRAAAGLRDDASPGQAPSTLIQVREFDRYQGKGIPDGKVSLSLRLTFQSPERTLADEDVQTAMRRIIDALTHELQAVQR